MQKCDAGKQFDGSKTSASSSSCHAKTLGKSLMNEKVDKNPNQETINRTCDFCFLTSYPDRVLTLAPSSIVVDILPVAHSKPGNKVVQLSKQAQETEQNFQNLNEHHVSKCSFLAELIHHYSHPTPRQTRHIMVVVRGH